MEETSAYETENEDITDKSTEESTEDSQSIESDIEIADNSADGTNIASYLKIKDGTITEYTGKNISNIKIPSTVNGVTITAIGDSVFEEHEEIQSVTFPNTLKTIGNYAFYNTPMGSNTKLGSLKIPASVNKIGYYAFARCKYLGTVEFENSSNPTMEGITFLEKYNSEGYTFSNCHYLSSIKLSNNVVTLPTYFAYNSDKLKTVQWGKNIKYIRDSAFEYCSSLESVDLSGTKAEKIYYSAFSECTSIAKVVFPVTLKVIGNASFYGSTIGTNKTLGSLKIPASVEEVGYLAFDKCKYLEKVEFTDVTTPTFEGINFAERYGSDGYTFANCPDLASIRLSNNAKILPTYFAYKCPKLKSITLQASEVTIPKYAFYVDHKTKTVIVGNSTGVKNYDWASDNRVKIGKYTIVFNSNKGDNKTFEQYVPRDESTALMSNTFEYKGYTFAGWNTKADGTGKSYTDKAKVKNLAKTNEKITLYAQWKAKTYKVTLHAEGGKIGNSSTKTVKVKYEKNYAGVNDVIPKYKGYIFKGWYVKEGNSEKIYDWSNKKVTEPAITDLYAHWEETKYNLNFNPNTKESIKLGTVTTSKGVKINTQAGKIYNADGGIYKSIDSPYFGVLVSYNESIGLTGNEFTRKGYTISGWNTKKDGSGKSYSNASVIPHSIKDVTLYAKWTKVKYVITYDLDGGKNSSKNPSKYTITSNTIKLNAPVKKGYTFVGWFNNNGKQITQIEKGSIGNVSLKAKWKKESGESPWRLMGCMLY